MAKRLKFDKHSTTDVDMGNIVQNKLINSEAMMNNQSLNYNDLSEEMTYLASPTKSQSDVKDYSVIKLKNGLTALLISDKTNIINLDNVSHSSDSESSESDETNSSESCSEEDTADSEDEKPLRNTNKCEEKLAACALCIGVGSFSDPENIPGLAHFLEHMIFMGSEKYPKENEFDVFIKKKGGSDNASTECEFTTFYFDCHEAYLKGAMEIFSQLFISPIMKRESMTKEREAIESEFQMSLPSDESRKSQLLCSLADEGNPAHKFMWGNLITLRDQVKDDDLYKAVHEFRKRHYSAHRMTLTVQARLPIEILEKWVIEFFKHVENNGLPHDEFILTVPPFKQVEFSKLYIVEPVKNINHLDLTWVMPSTLQMFNAKPLHYLSWVIGHEGKGSLLSYLRKKLWSFDISVASGGDGTEENSIYTLFSISLVLTNEGMQHVEDILNLVFQYIKMLQDIGPQERLFNEMKLIAETSFRFSEEVAPSDNVEQLAENMHFYPSTHYLSGAELFFEYDPCLISSFLNELKAENVNVMITSKKVASTENLDKVEKWFGTKYKSKEIPAEWVENWKNIKLNKEFYLPEENPFITSDFTILQTPTSLEEFPKNIYKDEILELWYKQDVTFKLPHAFCYLNLVSPLPQKSALNAAMLDLFIEILKESLAEELYPANVAQLQYSVHTSERGIAIVISGFNEKLIILLQTIISRMRSLRDDLKPDMFLAMKDELKRGYYNDNLKPCFLGREIRMSILLETFWTVLEKKKALKYVTYETLKEFVSHYFEHLYIQCLIQGNVSKDESIAFGELVKHGLSSNSLLINTAPEIRINELPHEDKFCVVHSFNIEDANSVVTNYYQSGLGSIQESCIIELLMMMMEEPMFDSLRTKQQLGYDVSCTLHDTFGILGFSVSVHCQSDRNSVEFVENRITEFLKGFLQTLKNISQEDFNEIKESLIKLKKCANIHLKEEVKRNWDEIKSEEYVFDRHYRESEFIENLSLEDVIKWFAKTSGTVKSSKSKKLSIQVVGKVPSRSNDTTDPISNFENGVDITDNINVLNFHPQSESCDKYIFDINNFKHCLSIYPPHKIIG